MLDTPVYQWLSGAVTGVKYDSSSLELAWTLITVANDWSFVVGRGGQSALRFARLRMEKRHNYVRKVAETAVQMFISNDRPNVAGLVLAGSADFKTELSQSDMFDQVLWAVPNVMICVISRTRLCYYPVAASAVAAAAVLFNLVWLAS